MDNNDFNPLVFKNILDKDVEEVQITAAEQKPQENALSAQALMQHYQTLAAQYQHLQAQQQDLQEKFFALADVMYQMLAFINIQRLYQGKNVIMANDIADTVENNPILTQLSNHLREAAIASSLGIISQFEDAQNHLRNTVMYAWRQRFHSEERESLAKKLFVHQENHSESHTKNQEDDVF